MDVQIDAKVIKGPVYGARGAFEIWIAWETDAKDGYIVQHVVRETESNNPSGTAPVRQATDYWEAWRVTGSGVFARKQITEGVVNDCFSHAARAANTWGKWTIIGDIYYLPEEGFREAEWIKNVQQVGGAGCLYHRSTRPNPDYTSDMIMSRYNQGYWSAMTGTPAFHQPGKPQFWPPLPPKPLKKT